MRNGAQDFLTKPIDMNRLLQSLHRTIDNPAPAQAPPAAPPVRRRRAHSAQAERIIGVSPEIEHVRQLIDKVAPCEARVLITGENGTGKDVIARLLYRHSPRSGKPFVTIDLGSIPEQLFESELFGYEKGAFTDARKAKAGRMEVATGGTLFLDEIGNLSLPMQAKLLTAIEKRQISRLGSTQSTPIDVRLICATNADIRRMVEEGRFRQDLLYRINTIELRLPPLRERGDDLFLLADFFVQRYARKYHKEIKDIGREARRQLQQYRWPGNVRELEHAVERAVILTSGPMLAARDFHLQSRLTHEPLDEKERYNLERIERESIDEVLRLCNGNITLAAEMLGITRTSLYRRIEKYKL